MKTRRLLTLAISILWALNTNVCLLFAKAPTTPKILFASARDGNRDVYIMNPDGSEQINLTKHPADDQRAVWSPTGEQILFISNREYKTWGNWDLYLMDPDGSNVRRVFKQKKSRNDPTWAPDGKQISYTHTNWEAGTFHIYIATLGEQEEERLTEGFYPAWSPDGTEIAYTTYLANNRRITLINPRTGQQKRLLPRKAIAWQNSPSWPALGDKLAFSWNNNPLPPIDADRDVWDEWQTAETIYLVNRDGTELQQLIEEDGPYATDPALSPNGDEVLYTQEINDRFQIFKLDINNGIRTQLTHAVGLSLFQANAGGDWFDPDYALPVTPQPKLLTTTWGTVKINRLPNQ